MSDLYRIRWDAAATIGAPLIVEDKQHGKLGVLVPATDERLTRAEWEAATQLPSRDNLRDIAESAGVSRATLFWILDEMLAAVKDQTEAMPQPVQGGGAESSTPAPPVDSHRHLFCTNHQSMAPVELNRCKEAYYREYSAYGQPCSLYPIESLILEDPAVKGAGND